MIETLLAPNPGPMTLEGTNTYLVGDGRLAIVVDPGPDDPRHLAAIEQRVEEKSLTVVGVLLTHAHADHSAGVPMVTQRFAAPRIDPVPGRSIDVGDTRIDVIATPGHTSDSVSFSVEGSLLTGDTVLGRGTTVVAWPDGDLADYLQSLEELYGQAISWHTILPGHGPIVNNPQRVLADYLAHRAQRLDQVRRALADGATTAEAIVDRVYSDTPAAVRPAAIMSVEAQLAYLRR